MNARAVRLDKVKRPGGVFAFDLELVSQDDHGIWVLGPSGSSWRAPHATGTLPVDVLVLLATDRTFVTWWVDDPSDRRIEIDVCLAPERTAEGWSVIDLELDVVRRERTGIVEVEDRGEFEGACQHGWISSDEARIAMTTAAQMESVLAERGEPWGDEGWRRLDDAKTLI